MQRTHKVGSDEPDLWTVECLRQREEVEGYIVHIGYAIERSVLLTLDLF